MKPSLSGWCAAAKPRSLVCNRFPWLGSLLTRVERLFLPSAPLRRSSRAGKPVLPSGERCRWTSRSRGTLLARPSGLPVEPLSPRGQAGRERIGDGSRIESGSGGRTEGLAAPAGRLDGDHGPVRVHPDPGYLDAVLRPAPGAGGARVRPRAARPARSPEPALGRHGLARGGLLAAGPRAGAAHFVGGAAELVERNET